MEQADGDVPHPDAQRRRRGLFRRHAQAQVSARNWRWQPEQTAPVALNCARIAATSPPFTTAASLPVSATRRAMLPSNVARSVQILGRASVLIPDDGPLPAGKSLPCSRAVAAIVWAALTIRGLAGVSLASCSLSTFIAAPIFL